MRVTRRLALMVSAGVLVVALLAAGVTALRSSTPASATITDSESIYMVVSSYGNLSQPLAWGPGASLDSPVNCTGILDHAIPVQTMTGGMRQTLSFGGATGAAAGKPSYSPVTITKSFDTSTTQLEKALATGTLINAQFYFFNPNDSPIDCSHPDMLITLVGVGVASESYSIPGTESIQLQYGLEAQRTATQVGQTNQWDKGGFCWNVVKNAACNVASPPPSLS